jgi:hypothetical protein
MTRISTAWVSALSNELFLFREGVFGGTAIQG